MARILFTLTAVFCFCLQLSLAGSNTLVSGLVVDQFSHPVSGVSVTLRPQSEVGSQGKGKEYRTSTDGQGDFKFSNIDEGYYEMSLEKGSFELQKRMVTVQASEPKSLLITLNPANGKSGSKAQAVSGKMFHLKDINPKSARVFITFSGLQMKVPGEQPSLNPQDLTPDLPGGNIPDMGAQIYGKQGENEASVGSVDPFSPDSVLLVSAQPNSISVMDVGKQEIVGAIPTDASPIWLAFSPEGSRFWTVDSMHQLSMYSANGDLVRSVSVGEGLVTDLAVDGPGSHVYLVVRTWPDPEILVADASTNALIGGISLPGIRGAPGGIAVSSDGSLLVVAMGTTKQGWLEVVDPVTRKVVKEIEVGAQPMGVGITPDGSRAVVAEHRSGAVDIVDLQSGKDLIRIRTGLFPARVAMRSDGRVAYVTNNGDDTLSVIDVGLLRPISKVKVGKGPMGVAVSADGKNVYVVNHDSASVTVVDGYSLAILATTPAVKGVQAFGVAIRPETLEVSKSRSAP